MTKLEENKSQTIGDVLEVDLNLKHIKIQGQDLYCKPDKKWVTPIDFSGALEKTNYSDEVHNFIAGYGTRYRDYKKNEAPNKDVLRNDINILFTFAKDMVGTSIIIEKRNTIEEVASFQAVILNDSGHFPDQLLNTQLIDKMKSEDESSFLIWLFKELVKKDGIIIKNELVSFVFRKGCTSIYVLDVDGIAERIASHIIAPFISKYLFTSINSLIMSELLNASPHQERFHSLCNDGQLIKESLLLREILYAIDKYSFSSLASNDSKLLDTQFSVTEFTRRYAILNRFLFRVLYLRP